jgi:hypothetical protein
MGMWRLLRRLAQSRCMGSLGIVAVAVVAIVLARIDREEQLLLEPGMFVRNIPLLEEPRSHCVLGTLV